MTLEAGTGAVHTAPAHGQDDFIVGVKYSLPVDNPVMGDGRFREGTPFVAGLKVDAANDVLIKELESRGRLLKHETIKHSYPHCWRHKTPVIFRATPQWFISMDQKGLRANALRDITKTQWVPAWGEQRIYNMIKDRPDWCLSRQRTWGVPIALFVHKETQELHPRTQELIEEVARRVEKDGIDAWFDLDAAELLGADAEAYEKVTDVMDVWADSGLSHECVHQTHPDEIRPPVELYLEGSDQHRGWFHSSLLMSEALYSRAPYKAVLTHGFTVDENGRKSRSRSGNVIEPKKVMSTLGADVLRLWIAATDYSNEMALSDEILKRMSESYRRMRNTVRFLLGNLAGFDPATDALAPAEMVAIDRWALQRTAALHEEIADAYRKYEYHLIYQKIHNFCVVDPGWVLSRPAERPALHDAEEGCRAPLGADRAVPHRREHGALARADPFVHGRRDLELPARQAQRVGVPGDLARGAESAGGPDRLEPAHPAQGRGRAGTRKAARRRHHRRLTRCRGRSLQQG